MLYVIFAGVTICVIVAGFILTRRQDSLSARCQKYLSDGPPPHMKNCVSESVTEMIIAQGEESRPLDDELLEAGEIMLSEPMEFSSDEDDVVRRYLNEGEELAREVIERQRT